MQYANIYADGRSNNSLFELEDHVHRFNPSHTPRLLREVLLSRGIELNTPDLNRDRPVESDRHQIICATMERISRSRGTPPVQLPHQRQQEVQRNSRKRFIHRANSGDSLVRKKCPGIF